ncbi:MAG TPA: NAD(P)-dependent oxidoreductase [Solirubrobacteraceae bacterium]|nr:NAD(P)-dependent oxidoreductase [Solirubrobacteraceae bacterium]
MTIAAVPSRLLETFRERAPVGVEIVAYDDDADLRAVRFLVPTGREILDALPGLTELSVIQTLSAGTDWIEPYVPPDTILCSARGARDGPVAEWVVGALLGASTQLLRSARERAWDDQRELQDLGGSTVLIVGMGSIGHRVAAYLAPLEVSVVGVGSRAHDGLHGVEELPVLLPDADAVVVLTPLTEATRGLIGAAELAAMPDGSLLVNAARGAVVDTEALVAELSDGRLRAVLDVTDPEPLPDDHPLWTAPGTLSITPHIGGDSPAGHARAAALATEQLARWAAGEPLRNVVLDVPRILS